MDVPSYIINIKILSYLFCNLVFADDVAHVIKFHLPSDALTRLFCLQSEISNIAYGTESLTSKAHCTHCIDILKLCNFWSRSSFCYHIEIYLFNTCTIIYNLKALQSIVEKLYIYIWMMF